MGEMALYRIDTGISPVFRVDPLNLWSAVSGDRLSWVVRA